MFAHFRFDPQDDVGNTPRQGAGGCGGIGCEATGRSQIVDGVFGADFNHVSEYRLRQSGLQVVCMPFRKP